VISESARREIAHLTRHAVDTRLDPVERAGALLIAHQRMDAGTCLCGWAKLGKSHAAHQADELARAGLLVAADDSVVQVIRERLKALPVGRLVNTHEWNAFTLVEALTAVDEVAAEFGLADAAR
jgi:hypothetical protein